MNNSPLILDVNTEEMVNDNDWNMTILSEVMSKCMLVMLFWLRIIYPTMILMLLLNDLHIVRVVIMEELGLPNVETRTKG